MAPFPPRSIPRHAAAPLQTLRQPLERCRSTCWPIPRAQFVGRPTGEDGLLRTTLEIITLSADARCIHAHHIQPNDQRPSYDNWLPHSNTYLTDLAISRASLLLDPTFYPAAGWNFPIGSSRATAVSYVRPTLGTWRDTVDGKPD